MCKLRYKAYLDNKFNGDYIAVVQQLNYLIIASDYNIKFYKLDTLAHIKTLRVNGCQDILLDEEKMCLYYHDVEHYFYRIDLSSIEVELDVKLKIQAELGKFIVVDRNLIVIEGWDINHNLYLCDVINGNCNKIASMCWAEPLFRVNNLSMNNGIINIEYEVHPIYFEKVKNEASTIYLTIKDKKVKVEFAVKKESATQINLDETFSLKCTVNGFLRKTTSIVQNRAGVKHTIAKLDFPLYELQTSLVINRFDCLACLFGNALLLFKIDGDAVMLAEVLQFEKTCILINDIMLYDDATSRLFFVGDCGGYVQFKN